MSNFLIKFISRLIIEHLAHMMAYSNPHTLDYVMVPIVHFLQLFGVIYFSMKSVDFVWI